MSWNSKPGPEPTGPKEETKDLRADYIRAILADLGQSKAIKGFSVEEFADGACELQVHMITTGQHYSGIKWTIGELYTKEAILATAFEALCAAFNDLMRHTFTYKGAAIFKMTANEREKFLGDK